MNTLLVDIKEVVASFDERACFLMYLYDNEFKQQFMKNLPFYAEKFTCIFGKYDNRVRYGLFNRLTCLKDNNEHVVIHWNKKAYKFVVDGICWEYQPTLKTPVYELFDVCNNHHVQLLYMFGMTYNYEYKDKINIAYINNYIVGFKVNDTVLSVEHIMDRIADKYLVFGDKKYLLDRLSVLPKNNNDLVHF